MNNFDFVDSLVRMGVLKTPSLIEAFEHVDRIDFVPHDLRYMAYADRPLPIGSAQTISQPYTVAFMLELLAPQASDKVLDLGSGSGWTSALLAYICKHVDAVERVKGLVEFSKKNLSAYHFKNLSLHHAKRSLGLEGEHFDKILVSCAADEIPQPLLEQLNIGGTIVIPVENSIIKAVKEDEGRIKIEEYPGFIFVPLIREDK